MSEGKSSTPEINPVPTKAHHVRTGGYCILKGFPCKIVEVKTSKTGKHGHAKCNITGVSVLDGRKHVEIGVPGHISKQGFKPIRIEYEVSHIEDDDIHCMDEACNVHVFAMPETDEFKKLTESIEASEADPDSELVHLIQVVYAPVAEPEWHVEHVVDGWKKVTEAD